MSELPGADRSACGWSLEDHMAAVLAGAGPEIDQIVGGADRLLVVLDDEHGVAEIAELAERGEQTPVVALVQADRRLVEHVQHAGELRSDLRRQANPLPFSARQRRRAPAEREIAHADVGQKPQAIADFAHDPSGDEQLALGELDDLEEREHFRDGEADVLGQPAALDAHGAAFGPESRAFAGRARAERAVRLERLLIGPRAGFEPAAQIRDRAFEIGAERIGARLAARTGRRLRRRIGVLTGFGRPVGPAAAARRAVQHEVALFLRQLAERHRRVDRERPAEPLDQIRDEPLVAGPRRDRALLERLRLVGDDARRIEVVDRAESLTIRTGAVGRVEREGARRHLRNADAARRAGHPAREQPVAAVERVDDDDVVGELEGEIDRLAEAALDAGLDDESIDEDVDRVIAAAVERDLVVERDALAVDARPREAARAECRELALELALAPADHRREHVDALVGRIEHHHVHDALERLRRDRAIAVRAVRHADVREEQPQVVVDLGDGPDRRSRVGRRRLLLDRDGR